MEPRDDVTWLTLDNRDWENSALTHGITRATELLGWNGRCDSCEQLDESASESVGRQSHHVLSSGPQHKLTRISHYPLHCHQRGALKEQNLLNSGRTIISCLDNYRATYISFPLTHVLRFIRSSPNGSIPLQRMCWHSVLLGENSEVPSHLTDFTAIALSYTLNHGLLTSQE